MVDNRNCSNCCSTTGCSRSRNHRNRRNNRKMGSDSRRRNNTGKTTDMRNSRPNCSKCSHWPNHPRRHLLWEWQQRAATTTPAVKRQKTMEAEAGEQWAIALLTAATASIDERMNRWNGRDGMAMAVVVEWFVRAVGQLLLLYAAACTVHPKKKLLDGATSAAHLVDCWPKCYLGCSRRATSKQQQKWTHSWIFGLRMALSIISSPDSSPSIPFIHRIQHHHHWSFHVICAQRTTNNHIAIPRLRLFGYFFVFFFRCLPIVCACSARWLAFGSVGCALIRSLDLE